MTFGLSQKLRVVYLCALQLGGSIMGCCALCCKKGPVAEKKANDSG